MGIWMNVAGSFGVKPPQSPAEANQQMFDLCDRSHPACANGLALQKEIIAELIHEYGADPRHTDAQGNNAVLHALKKGEKPSLELYMFDWMQANTEGDYPALEALCNGHSNVEDLLAQTNAVIPRLYTDYRNRLPEGDRDACDRMNNNPSPNSPLYDEACTMLELQKAKADAPTLPLTTRREFLCDMAHKQAGRYPPHFRNSLGEIASCGQLATMLEEPYWKGHEQKLLEVVASLPRAWRWQAKDHPLIKDRWQDVSDIMPPSLNRLRTVEEFLEPDGKAKMSLLVWAQRNSLPVIPDDFENAGRDLLRIYNAVPPEYLAEHYRNAYATHERNAPLERPDNTATVKYLRGHEAGLGV